MSQPFRWISTLADTSLLLHWCRWRSNSKLVDDIHRQHPDKDIDFYFAGASAIRTKKPFKSAQVRPYWRSIDWENRRYYEILLVSNIKVMHEKAKTLAKYQTSVTRSGHQVMMKNEIITAIQSQNSTALLTYPSDKAKLSPNEIEAHHWCLPKRFDCSKY